MSKKKEIDYLEQIKELLTKLPRIMHVRFAYYCARSVIENIKNKQDYDKVNACLLVVHRYIKGEAVTQKELINAANSATYSATYLANSATYSAAYSANSAANSAYLAYSATYLANSATYSAAYSANSAANSAYLAYSATYLANSATYSAALKGYYEYLIKDTADLTELERIIYNIEV